MMMKNSITQKIVAPAYQETEYLLVSVAPRFEYVNNRKTDSVIGYRYLVMPWCDRTVGLITVTVLDTRLPEGVSVEDPPDGDIFLRFSDWSPVKCWKNSFTGKWEDAYRAGSVEVVTEAGKSRTLPTM